jgi:hypothetical protein
MEKIVLATKSKGPTFRLFTEESLKKIEARVAEDKERARKEEEEKKKEEEEDGRPKSVATARERARKAAEENKQKVRQRPNQALEAGKKFPEKLGEFPPELYGKPIEDLDEYYHNKFVSNVEYLIMKSGQSNFSD